MDTSLRFGEKTLADLVNAADQSAKPFLENSISLREFRRVKGDLPVPDRALIVDQAIRVIEGYYVHLPFKRAMHAIDPLQRLRLLRRRLPEIEDEQYIHQELIQIFTCLRDLHTRYYLPNPYGGRKAWLPFSVERCFNGGTERYLVTSTTNGFSHPGFGKGTELLDWNGVPIERAVQLAAETHPGSNFSARLARGIQGLTVRSLTVAAPPDEEWVVIGYLHDGKRKEILFDWAVSAPPGPVAWTAASLSLDNLASLAMDFDLQAVHETRKKLFAQHRFAKQRDLEEAASLGNMSLEAAVTGTASTMGDIFEADDVKTGKGTFGYLRIRAFSRENDNFFVEAFVQEFKRLLDRLSPHGLILDVRDNPGGFVAAGERILQMLTPKSIEPTRFQLINTPATVALAEDLTSLKPWQKSLARAVQTGAAFSASFPLTNPSLCNDIGQHYYGPVVLVTNARCYSTTDIFAAGFKDHNIGFILGTDENTGAGGANVWNNYIMQQLFAGAGKASPLPLLPKSAQFSFSIRRTLRVGPEAGTELEDLGVEPDEHYQVTERDIASDMPYDLLEKAALLLDQQSEKRGRFVVKSERKESSVHLRIESQNLDRIDIFVDGRPYGSRSTKRNLEVDLTDMPASAGVQLLGYKGSELFASHRLTI